MKTSNNNLTKTIAHNNKLREQGSERVKRSMLDIKEEEIGKAYRKRKFDMLNVLKAPPDELSVYAKAVRVDDESKDEENLTTILERGKDILRQLHQKVNCTKENNKRIIALFPEVKMAGEIIISSILSPNKLTDTQLNYKIEKNFDVLDEEVQTMILSEISEYIDKEYALAEKLPDILNEALMSSGACPHIILSEAVVDDVVNSDILNKLSLEEFKEVMGGVVGELTRPIGLISQEDSRFGKDYKDLEIIKEIEDVTEQSKAFVKFLANNGKIHVTDNQGIFTLGKVKTKLRSNIIKNTLRNRASITMESTDKINFLDIFRDRRVNAEYKPTIVIHDKKEATRKAIGKPLVMKLPTESVFPALALGNKDEHLGYFVLLDDNGEPITSETSATSFERLANNLTNDTFTANPITTVYQDLVTKGDGKCIDIGGLFGMYREIMDYQLYEMFNQRSIYGEEVHIPNVTDFHYITFSRALKAQSTTILYIPKESLVYFSLFNNDAGIGKTILEDLNTIYSMRAILLFAKVMAQIRNSIDITDVVVGLNPNDPDPEMTMEKIKVEMLKLRANDFPLGENDPHRLLDWIQKAGLKFNFKNHPGIPEMDIDFQKNNMQYNEPDSEFYENLGKAGISGMGLPPETIDQAYSPDFAAGVFQNSALLAKRTTMYQKQLMPEITKFVAAIIYTDEDLRVKLKEIVMNNKKAIEEKSDFKTKALQNISEEEYVEDFLDRLSQNVYVELPRISEGNLNNLAQEFEDYKARVEAALDIVLNDEMFNTENTPGIESKVKLLKVSLLAKLCRSWAADNNYLPELFSLIGSDKEEIDDALEGIDTHFESIYRTVVDLVNSLKDIRKAGGDDIARIEEEESGGDDSSSSGW